MVKYFREDLKSSIKAEIDQDATYLDNYEELVVKAVSAKTKAGLGPSSYIREIDIQVLWGSWLIAHIVQILGGVNCEGDSKASKAPASTQESESSNKARKDKKKKQHKDKKNSREPRDSPTSATEVSTAEVGGKKRRNKKDMGKVTYFNCNKKGHYANR